MSHMLQSSLTALTLVSIPSQSALSQSKQITQCAHEDDSKGENSVGKPHVFVFFKLGDIIKRQCRPLLSSSCGRQGPIRLSLLC